MSAVGCQHVGHMIEGTACPEPFDLGRVHRVVQCHLVTAAIGMLQNTLDGLYNDDEILLHKTMH